MIKGEFMKKLLFVSLSIAFLMVCSAFLMPSIKKATSLPNDMVVTYSDIEEANNKDKYSAVINLELPKNINVSQNGELVDTVMSVKLFNLFTIKKING